MTCRTCGARIADPSAVTCPACGSGLAAVTETSETLAGGIGRVRRTVTSRAYVASGAGVEIQARSCAACGAPAPSEATVCAHCGSPLPPAVSPPPTVPTAGTPDAEKLEAAVDRLIAGAEPQLQSTLLQVRERLLQPCAACGRYGWRVRRRKVASRRLLKVTFSETVEVVCGNCGAVVAAPP